MMVASSIGPILLSSHSIETLRCYCLGLFKSPGHFIDVIGPAVVARRSRSCSALRAHHRSPEAGLSVVQSTEPIS